MAKKMISSTPIQGKSVRQQQGSQADFKKLHHFLDAYFNLREQDELCATLKIDSPQVPGQTKETRGLNLIKAAAMADRLPDLIALIKQERPLLSDEIAQLNLTDHSAEFLLDLMNGTELPFARPTQLAIQLASHLKVQALPDLCFDLGVDHENLGGLNHLENVQNLVSLMESRDQRELLLAHLSQEWPATHWIV